VLWDGSVWEKPESLKSEGLGPVQSGKARRLTHIKPGYYPPQAVRSVCRACIGLACYCSGVAPSKGQPV